MPWKIDDVDAHNKGLSPKQKRMWVQVANDALARCQKKKGSNCDAAAIKQANGVVARAGHSADFCANDTPLTFDQIDFAASEPLFSDDDGEFVLRSGLLFRAGDYPDKDYSMTADELAAAAETFSEPVPLDLEHMPTILDGKLGEVISISAFSDELHGVVKLPKWLDDAIGDTPRKVSATWLRDTKTLVGLALCVYPRIEDAALMTAFGDFAAKRHDTPHGRMAVQDIHDTCARAGAVCKQPGDDKAKHASRHESQAIQQAHDIAAQHGAKCHAIEEGRPMWAPYRLNPDATLTNEDAAALSLGLHSGSNTGRTNAPVAPRKESRMGWKERFAQAIMGLPDDLESDEAAGAATGAQTPPAATPPVVPAAAVQHSAAEAALSRAQQEAEAAKAELRRERARNITNEATAFADLMVSEGRAMPAEREGIITAYAQALWDDVNFGAVEMSDGTKSSRTAMFKATIAKRDPHQLSMERLAPEFKAFITAKEETQADPNAGMTAERKAELLSHTSLGQSALNGANKN